MKNKYSITNIFYSCRDNCLTKECKYGVQSIIDSIEYSTDKIEKEVQDYYNNRSLLEKNLINIKAKKIPFRIIVFKDKLSEISNLN